jgi:hypothetical protein
MKCSLLIRRWDFNSGGFVSEMSKQKFETRHLLFDSVSNLYREFKEDHPQSPISKTKFQMIKKTMGCVRAE